MSRPATRLLIIIAFMCPIASMSARNAIAQQQQQISYTTSPENSKYLQQLNVDVGDTPNHIVRVFELHRVPTPVPVMNGLRLVGDWIRGLTDVTDGNGSSTVYAVFALENGDRFFARLTQVNQNISGKISATAVGPITGGTGELAEIHGVVQLSANFDVKSGFNKGQTDIEFSIGK
jgi:hypothetical protein